MTDDAAPKRALVELYRSDDLSELRKMVEGLSRLPVEVQRLVDLPPQIPIVIDANQAYADIFIKLRAQAPNYRTDLEELADSGCIAIHAPRLILKEVADHIEEASAQHEASTEAAMRAWEGIQRRITFHEVPSDPSIEITDPKDAPYVALSNALGGALIVTRDKAIHRASPHIAEPISLGPLKKAIRLSVPVGKLQMARLLAALVLGSAGAEAFEGAVRLLSDRRVQIVLAVLSVVAGVGAAIYLSDKENRKKVGKHLDGLIAAMDPFLEVLGAVQKEFHSMQDKSQEAWQAAAPFAAWTPAPAIGLKAQKTKTLHRKRTRRGPSTDPRLSTGE
jgi:predicted nucleic acid-binding protein